MATSILKPRKMLEVKAIAFIMLALAISAILILVTVLEIQITAYGTLDTATKTIYVTATTVMATILTRMITGQIIELYLCRFDDQYVPLVLVGQPTTSPAATALISRWRAILGVGSVFNALRYRNLGTTMTQILAGLVTACITAGLTPVTVTREVSHIIDMPSGDATIFARPYLPSEMPDPLAAVNHSVWQMSNGSLFYSWSGRGGSPAHEAIQLAGGINIVDPAVYAYADEGVAVRSSAIGVPYSLYAANLPTEPNLSGLLREYEWNIREISACLPVMVRNPYKCRKGGHMDWTNNDRVFRISSDDNSCIKTRSVSGINDVEMLMWWCTHDSIGQATVLIGSNFNYHAWVAVAVNDDDIPPYSVPPRYTYSVQCDVDARNVFEYRRVSLKLRNSGRGTSSPGFSRILVVEDPNTPCSPKHNYPAASDTLLATTATATHYLLSENSGSSGWFETINRLTTRSGGYGLSAAYSKRSPPWAFADSSNALEDILGLTSALVSSRIIKNSTAVQADGVATVEFTRVGSGSKAALLFAGPPFLSAVALVVLLARVKRRGPGYESTNPGEMVDLGMVVGMGVSPTGEAVKGGRL